MLRIVAGALLNTAVYGALLLIPAARFAWWQAWVVLGIIFVTMIGTRLWLMRDDRGLLTERRKPPLQRGQPLADKTLVIAFMTTFPAYIIFIPIDVFRLHLINRPTMLVSWFGLLLLVAGVAIIALAFRANAFAAGIVKYQPDRGQAVIDSGPYAVVRHPIYSGVGLLIIGLALWLQSYAAAIAALVPIALLAVRIGVEERFLSESLAGYPGYIQRVRSRVIPRIW